MKAQVVPYSSVVGHSIMLLDDDGAVIAQLALLNIQPAGLSIEDRKRKSSQISKWLVEAINAAHCPDRAPEKE